MQRLLDRYAEALTPWAERISMRMLLEVDERDREAWRTLGNAISHGMANLIQRTPVGTAMKKLLDEQVTIITSLPTEAGKRVHELTLKGLEDSTRAREISKEIERTGDVTESRAILIARTEVARTSSVLIETRAQAAGLTHYIWRTAHDGTVRPGHKAMEGKVCEWANPPAVVENGKIMHFHAGQIWNCRCYPEPIIID
jgi:SPP1 gp7 family putative phage head morphogenesis protein